MHEYIVSKKALQEPDTYRVMAEIVTKALDPGELYPVPLDYKLCDMVLPEYTVAAIWECLEQAGFSREEWELMTFWQPETNSAADAF